LTWDYPTEGEHIEPSAEAILKEMNGYTWPDRNQISTADDLKDDGTTACGVWIYCGAHPQNDFNQSRSRKPDGSDGPGSHLGWAFAWPNNRRILNNRASADPEGRPWSEEKKYIWWDADKGEWTGKDNVDFSPDKPPGYVPDWSQKPEGMEALRGDAPFIMLAEGRANLLAPSGLKDGPLPTHYEPVESPVENLLYDQQENPAVKKWERPDNQYHAVGDPDYPYIITTYRLTEHHTSGMMTRCVPNLAELQPEGFCEIPTELAKEKGIKNLDWVVLWTRRGAIEVKALVTDRLQPFQIDGKTVHQIGMPWHYGWEGYATGDIANTLSSVVGDPNTTIHEGKAFTCNLKKGRLERNNAHGNASPDA
jgi:formate dehydrogenase major subunit